MRQIVNFLSVLISIYMMVIVVRIILTWFRGIVRTPALLSAITDPYLAWFRQFKFLRIGYLDISPIAALAVLTILNQILATLAQYGTIRLGILLAMCLRVIWSVASFFLVFIIIILFLRLIAYLSNQNTYGSFWRIIDTISQPVLYRINRILFRGRIVNFRISIIVSAAVLTCMYFVLRLGVSVFAGFLFALPV